MKTFASAFALVSLFPAIFALTVNTPTNVVACQPILITWADGTAPYFLSIIPGGQPSASAIKTFPTQNGNSLTWDVDIQSGTSITISLKDSTGTQAYSDVVQIQGTDTSCVNTSVAVSGTDTGSAPTATGASGSGSSPAATPTNASNTVATTGPASSGSSTKGTGTQTGSSTAATTSNAASKVVLGKFGLAGVLGLVGLAAL